jgi:hypothetical protein
VYPGLQRTMTTIAGSAGLVLLSVLLHACVRDPLPRTCNALTPGQLVFSELRGKQSGADTYGQWIELFNPGAGTIGLAGISVALTKLDGSERVEIPIRNRELSIAPSGYLVMGRFGASELPSHVDYGYGDEFNQDLFSDGVLELYACGVLVDRVIYHGLPSQGTLALDGRIDPSAEANDQEVNWCTDSTEAPSPDSGRTQLGSPGTPRERNRPCKK